MKLHISKTEEIELTEREKMILSNIDKGRLTCERLKDWVNVKFKQFQISDCIVTDIQRTRFRAEDYEAGASFLYVRFDLKDTQKRKIGTSGYFLCFYPIKDYEKYLKNGYELILKFTHNNMCLLSHLEIDVKKVSH